MGGCEECGFDFSAYNRGDVVERVSLAAATTAGLLQSTSAEVVTTRPSPDRWSVAEYAAHIRDVLLTIRDRLVIGLVEDNPEFKSLYRDERVDLGLYAADTPAELASELESAAAMFNRLFSAIDPAADARLVQYGQPDPQPRTLLWMALQAVHESQHHLDDIRQNIDSQSGSC